MGVMQKSSHTCVLAHETRVWRLKVILLIFITITMGGTNKAVAKHHKDSQSFSPFASHAFFSRWSPFMGCCRRDFKPAMELTWLPVREPAGWVQLPNCGLAPAGRSGVGSWESCLDILDWVGGRGVAPEVLRRSDQRTYQKDKYAGELFVCMQEGWKVMDTEREIACVKMNPSRIK